MKLSKQLFLDKHCKPKYYVGAKTSKLMSDGLITYNLNKGIPFYLPIGKRILKKMQGLILSEAERQDMYQIEVPYLVKDRILESKEGLSETFSKRVIKLENYYLKGYHLRATPEPSILNLADSGQLTHAQLPIRYVFNVESFMGVQSPENILRGQQFNSFIGASLNDDKNSLDESLKLFENIAENIFKKLGINVLKTKGYKDKEVEFFYKASEGDNILIPDISPEKIRCVSLGMIYNYNSKNGMRIKFKDRDNKNSEILYGTFGLGLQRVFYAMMDSSRDLRGFNLKELAPFNFSIIPINANFLEKSLEVYDKLSKNTMFDDRKNKEWGKKASFSDYIGIPYKIIINKENYILKDRLEKETIEFKTLEKLITYTENEINVR